MTSATARNCPPCTLSASTSSVLTDSAEPSRSTSMPGHKVEPGSKFTSAPDAGGESIVCCTVRRIWPSPEISIRRSFARRSSGASSISAARNAAPASRRGAKRGPAQPRAIAVPAARLAVPNRACTRRTRGEGVMTADTAIDIVRSSPARLRKGESSYAVEATAIAPAVGQLYCSRIKRTRAAPHPGRKKTPTLETRMGAF
jgi:hypothetical protein